MKRRVVVTGLGAVTPIGNTVEEFWKGIRDGKVGIGPITRFDTTGYKVTLAAEVKDFKIAFHTMLWQHQKKHLRIQVLICQKRMHFAQAL